MQASGDVWRTSSPTVMDEEAALDLVALVIDRIERGGVAEVAAMASGKSPVIDNWQWSAALAALSRPPLGTMLAEALTQKVWSAFQPCLRRYQQGMTRSTAEGEACEEESTAKLFTTHARQAALEELYHDFCLVQPPLANWCRLLGSNETVVVLAASLRSAVLQPDLLSGAEPPAWRELNQFLRVHTRSLLAASSAAYTAEEAEMSALDGGSRRTSSVRRSGTLLMTSVHEGGEDEDEESGVPQVQLFSHLSVGCRGSAGSGTAPGAGDSVLKCLHGLTLSSAREIKRLWRDVLEESIAEKIAALEDEYSTHFVKEYIVWEERVVAPFVAMALSGSGAAGGGCGASAGASAASFNLSHSHRSGRVGGSWHSAAIVALADRLGDDEGVEDDPASVRAERDRWCAGLKQRLLTGLARKRITAFWDIIVEFPDSIPALEDILCCLQACPQSSLRSELVSTARSLLASRLHRAGTRTEDILAILIKTIHSLCVLTSRSEQSAVIFSVVADTLEHLRKRKDCVPALVQVITQPSADSAFFFDSRVGGAATSGVAGARATTTAGATQEEEDDDEEEEALLLHPDGSAAAERPNVLRVLLAAINVKSLVQEYQQALAQQLLVAKPMHDFDTTPEEEVLERLKCVFGEDALTNCIVMVRDLQMSRRTTQQIRAALRDEQAEKKARMKREERRGRGSVNYSNPNMVAAMADQSIAQHPEAVSASVLSMTAWPKLHHCASSGELGPAPEKYRPHPSLRQVMTALEVRYKHMKANQKLVWVLSQGRVALDVKQKHPDKPPGSDEVITEHVLSLFAASLVLYVKDLQGEGTATVPVETLAVRLEVPVQVVLQHIPRLVPSILMHTANGVGMQRTLVTVTSNLVFDDAEKEDDGGKPAGMPPEELKMLERMITTMIKTSRAKSVNDIHNSMKMFGKFQGTVDDMKKVLHYFIKEGVLVLNEAKLYALPRK